MSRIHPTRLFAVAGLAAAVALGGMPAASAAKDSPQCKKARTQLKTAKKKGNSNAIKAAQRRVARYC